MTLHHRLAALPCLALLAAPLGCNGDDSGTSATASGSSGATTATTSATSATSASTSAGTGTSAASESTGGSDTASGTSTTGTSAASEATTAMPIFDVGADTDTGGGGGDVVTCNDAADKPSNIGCEFWAVDMDQQDGLSDPASAPWGVAISNVGYGSTDVTIEINVAPVGEPLSLVTVKQLTLDPDEVVPVELPTRELDCGVKPNDYASPGSCLSSQAFRITSTSPVVVYQFNVFKNAFSNDASLLLPTPALGKNYRVLGWPAGHPVKVLNIIDRAAVTIVGTQPETTVTVKPSWRIKGNPPIPAANPGQQIVIKLGPFDVLNLETADGTFQDDPKTTADLTGTVVLSDKPVAVFSGVESTAAPGGVVEIPTFPGWTEEDTCCLDHLEEQLFPVESIGKSYVITRSPIRSTGSYHEPDVIRFVGVAEDAQVTTSLPPPFDKFTLSPGQVKTTWADADFVATATKPFMIAQLLISQEYVDGPYTGDPSLTVFPPVDQYRDQYRILTPSNAGIWGWQSNFVVFATEPDNVITIDGVEPMGCVVSPAGAVNGIDYESRRCPVGQGSHTLKGMTPFGIVAYGYGPAGSYAFPGGADVEAIYVPPT